MMPRNETTLAFRYLFIFRRVVVSLAVVGAVLAWAYQFQALTAALVCIGIGELLESSYYISVLHWHQRQTPSRRQAWGRDHFNDGLRRTAALPRLPA